VAAVLHNTYCSACGGRHTLCFPEEDIIFSSRDYEYDCPSTKRTVPVPHSGQSCVVANACPKGAVIVRRLKS
jgi:hypothetical protein